MVVDAYGSCYKYVVEILEEASYMACNDHHGDEPVESDLVGVVVVVAASLASLVFAFDHRVVIVD